jgi:hypothetical protein
MSDSPLRDEIIFSKTNTGDKSPAYFLVVPPGHIDAATALTAEMCNRDPPNSLFLRAIRGGVVPALRAQATIAPALRDIPQQALSRIPDTGFPTSRAPQARIWPVPSTRYL